MRKLKKTAAILLLTVIFLSSITGCSNSSDNSKSEPSVAEGGNQTDKNDLGEENPLLTGKVEFWNDKLLGAEQNELDKIYNGIASLSGIDVEFVSYPDTAAYQTAMQQSIRGQEAPGLFSWWSGPQLETLANNDLLEDLTDLWPEYVVKNGVSAEVAESFTFEGKIYAVPYSIIYNTIIFNTSVFDKYGLTVPSTFDEFLTVCQTLKENGVTPIGLKNDSWAGFIWFQAMLASYDPQLYQDICDGTKAYTDQDVVKVMNQWKDMLEKGYFSSPMTIQDMDKSLATGAIAMMLEPNYEAGTMVKEYGMVDGEDIKTFVLPSMNAHKKVIFYEVAPLCVAKTSKDKETAKEVLKSWFKKDFQRIITEVTSNVNTSEVKTDNACVNEMISYSTDTENYQMMLRYYENTPEEIRNIALDELMKFQIGNAGVEEVLNTIQLKAEEVFNN